MMGLSACSQGAGSLNLVLACRFIPYDPDSYSFSSNFGLEVLKQFRLAQN